MNPKTSPPGGHGRKDVEGGVGGVEADPEAKKVVFRGEETRVWGFGFGVRGLGFRV